MLLKQVLGCRKGLSNFTQTQPSPALRDSPSLLPSLPALLTHLAFTSRVYIARALEPSPTLLSKISSGKCHTHLGVVTPGLPHLVFMAQFFVPLQAASVGPSTPPEEPTCHYCISSFFRRKETADSNLPITCANEESHGTHNPIISFPFEINCLLSCQR